MRKNVIIRLWGGVGNQLFQYSFGKYLKKQYNLDVYYDIASFGKSDKLRKLEITYIIPEIPTISCILSKYKSFKNRILRLFLKHKYMIISENNFKINNILKSTKQTYIQGYWQKEEYAKYILEDIINNTIQIPSQLEDYLNEIILNSNSVSLHVRRGDYFSKRNIKKYGVCTAEYYENAINKINDIISSEKVLYIFSDDIEWVKLNLNLPASSIFIPNFDIPQFWYIYLMSKCHYNIISNSTFSWWGAYLNNKIDKIVISPSHWTFKSKETLALESWIKI